jgi:uncharacterized membrane protein (UPF0127 family)
MHRAGTFARQCVFAVFFSILVPIGMAAGGTTAQAPNFAATEIKLISGVGVAPITFSVRLAVTPRERAYGLMFSPPLPAKTGMLFLFRDAQPRSFWMKNTPIPLDLVFFDAEGILVKVISNTKPYTLNLYNSGVASKYVLEIGGGEADRIKLKMGMRLQLPIEIPTNSVKASKK